MSSSSFATNPRLDPPADYDALRASAERLKAFVHLPQEAAQPAVGGGPLAGFTFGIKDIIDTADMPTSYGSAIDPTYRPKEDALVVTRIRALGGTITGKTATTEFAWRSPSTAVNPHNPAHTPGGSSSGSASAVAAGLVTHALGTQTIGSVVRPAAFCGVVGFKPSYGAIPRTGVHPLSWSLDHVGLFARDMNALVAVFPALVGSDASDPHGFVPEGLQPGTPIEAAAAPRIALVEPPAFDRVTAVQREALERAADRLRTAGAEVSRVPLRPAYNRTLEEILVILRAEGRAIYRERVAKYPDRTSNHLKTLVAEGAKVSLEDYLAALDAQKRLRRDMAEDFSAFDAVLCVPATGEAPKGLADTGDPALCAPWTFIGAPALSLPFGTGPAGLPLGIQLVAPWLRDRRLLSVARFAEAAFAG